MDRAPHLKAIESVAGALRAMNKRYGAHMTMKGLAVLTSLYIASEQGQVMTKSKLFLRLQKTGNVNTRTATYLEVYRLIREGMIDQEGAGLHVQIVLSLAGRNYVKGVERYIRNLRLSDY